MVNDKKPPGVFHEIPWNSKCNYIGSKHSRIVNKDLRPISSEQQLDGYCKGCEGIEKCRQLL